MSRPVFQRVKEMFGEDVGPEVKTKDFTTFYAKRERIADVLKFLKEELAFDLFVYITAVDYLGWKATSLPHDKRFEVVYHLYSLRFKDRVRVKVAVDEGEKVPSVAHIFKGANWHEREVYDMFGIVFSGHPNLERILLWEGFGGHPLRKDYGLRQWPDLPSNE